MCVGGMGWGGVGCCLKEHPCRNPAKCPLDRSRQRQHLEHNSTNQLPSASPPERTCLRSSRDTGRTCMKLQ